MQNFTAARRNQEKRMHKQPKAGVRIDPALRREVNVLAAKRGVPPYQVLEDAVREYLNREAQKEGGR